MTRKQRNILKFWICNRLLLGFYLWAFILFACTGDNPYRNAFIIFFGFLLTIVVLGYATDKIENGEANSSERLFLIRTKININNN